MKLTSSILILGAMISLAYSASRASELRVGAAAVNLAADDSMVITGGIQPGRAKGQEGELRATAVVVEKPGQGKVAIVSCDVLLVTARDVQPALKEIEKQTGIAPDHVMVSATHTHHAPSTARFHGYDRDEKFCRTLREGIVRAVVEANKRLSDKDAAADLLFHLGEENTIGGNSRRLLDDGQIWWIGRANFVKPTGPFDPQLPVIGFRGPGKDASGDQWRAVLYGHSTHTIGTRRGGVRSPSFYGLAAQELEEPLGATVGFLEGASGSTHNIGGVLTDEAVRRLKVAVNQSLRKAERQRVARVVSVKQPFRFTVRKFDEETEDAKVERYCRKYDPRGADSTVGVFRTMRKMLAPDQGKERQTVIQAIVLGDVALVGVPAEFFTVFGLEIKKRSPFKHTVIVELANDAIGYLPDREAHKLGGYQTWMGLHSFAEIGTGERMADEAVKLLEEIQREMKDE